MAFAEDVYERSRETRDGQGTSRSLSTTFRHFPFTNHSFLPYNADFVVFTTGRPIAIDLPAALLRMNLYPPIHRTPFTLHITILPCGPDYQPFFPLHFSNCTVLPMLLACCALTPTTLGHDFVLTIDVSWLNEHNEKHASLPVP